MVVVLKPNATKEQAQKLKEKIESKNCTVHVTEGVNYDIFGLVGDTTRINPFQLESYDFVDKVLKVQHPFKLVNRLFQPENTVIDVEGVKIGDGSTVVMAGPCSVESEEQLITIAKSVKKSGAKIMRGGAFKPRSSPYSFQGLGEDGLKLLKKAKEVSGLPIVSEAICIETIELVAEYVDIVQIGARNMQNFALLKKAGKINKPILLKRGLSATIEELLMSAEYIVSEGNPNVILCERGIRTFETYTRNTLDISAIPIIKELSHLPIIVDPSHAAGKWHMVDPLSRASVAAGADGLIIEVHNDPENALCDGAQSLKMSTFDNLMNTLNLK